MLFWILFFSLIVILSFAFKKQIYLVWFILWLFAAFRYEVGTDYLGYMELYNSFISGSFPAQYMTDYGLVWILEFINLVGGSSQLLFFIYATLNFIFIYYGYKYYAQKNETLNILFVILFSTLLYFQTLSIIRFMLAGSILFYSSRYIIEGKFIKYLLGTILAAIFHPTAIVFILLYTIRYIKTNFSTIIIFILLCLAIIVLHPINYLIEFLKGSDLPYIFYLTNEKLNVKASLFGNINTLIYMILAITTYRFFTKNKQYEIIYLLLLSYIMVRVLSIDAYVFQRLSFYFRPFFVVYIGYLFINLKFTEKIIKQVLFILLITLASYGSLVGLSSRKGMQGAFYSQYSVNVKLFGAPYIFNIYGDLDSLPDTNMEQQ